MSSFMGAAWLDVARTGDIEAVLADLRTGEPAEPTTLRAWAGGTRIELYSRDRYDRLADLVGGVMQRTGAVSRAVVYLDHDEYGDEHIVVTRDGDGAVRRIHHVFAYPYDEDTGEYYLDGEPSMTDVPAAPGTGPGTTPGAVLDNPVARAMVAELFGVSPRLVEAAAERIPEDFAPLVVGAPSAWRDALGLEWVGAAGGPPINLRPGPVWRDAVARDVVPRLPGQWLPRDYDLVRLPAGPVMCLVSAGRSSGHAVIWPMYIPQQYRSLQFSIGLRSAAQDRAPDPIEPFLDELSTKALPFFDRYGHPDGLRSLCRERVDAAAAGHVDPHDLRCLAATEVILGRYSEAAARYSSLAELAADSPDDRLEEIGEEARVRSVLLRYEPSVVHDALRATIEQQLSERGLEAPQP